MILNIEKKENEVMKIFFKDWYSLREASKEYDPKLSNEKRSHRTVAYYFHIFKKKGWLEKNYITKMFSRVSKKGKKSNYPNKCLRYRFNLNRYFEYCEEKIKYLKKRETTKEIKKELKLFTQQDKKELKEYILDKDTREQILYENQEEDLINAISRYIIKHSINNIPREPIPKKAFGIVFAMDYGISGLPELNTTLNLKLSRIFGLR